MIPNLDATTLGSISAKIPALTAKGTQASTFSNIQRSIDSGRTQVILSATASATGATGVETAVTWTISSGSSATTTGVTYAIPAGKKFRITNIYYGVVANATGALAAVTFNLRMNPAGAVVVASTPLLAPIKIVVAAANLDFKNVNLCLPEGYEITGSATMNIGLTTNAVFAAGAATTETFIAGYLY